MVYIETEREKVLVSSGNASFYEKYRDNVKFAMFYCLFTIGCCGVILTPDKDIFKETDIFKEALQLEIILQWRELSDVHLQGKKNSLLIHRPCNIRI